MMQHNYFFNKGCIVCLDVSTSEGGGYVSYKCALKHFGTKLITFCMPILFQMQNCCSSTFTEQRMREYLNFGGILGLVQRAVHFPVKAHRCACDQCT